MKLAQLVLGPAGVGKSTYCEAIADHCQVIGRPVSVINLDPAAEQFFYGVNADIRDLVTIEDVTEEMNLGPNGGLVYCMEYFETHMNEWLDEALQGYVEDDYVLFDCPGQAELYSHLNIFRSFVEYLQNDGWTVCATYCLDSQFMTDMSKFVGGCFHALTAMMHLAVPHLNILTKMDLCPQKVVFCTILSLRLSVQEDVEDFLAFDKEQLLMNLQQTTGTQFAKLNAAVAELIEEFNLVRFVPLDITDTESVHNVLLEMDRATQYGEDRDFKTQDF